MLVHRLRHLTILLVTFACFLASIGYADVTPTPADPTPEAIIADQDLRSPRATLSYFLSVMEPVDGKPDLERAAKTLDTAELPALTRSQLEREIVVKLYAILDFKEISSSKAPSSTANTVVQIGDVNDYGIYLEQAGPNWRFSKSTVRDVPEMFREIERKISTKEMRKLGGSTATWLTIRSYVPERLKHTTFILENWHWIAAALMILAAVLVHYVIVLLLSTTLDKIIPEKYAKQTTRTIASIRKPLFVVVFTSALQLFLSTFDLQIDFYTFAVTWLSTFRTLALVLVTIRLIPLFSDRINRIAVSSTSVSEDILYPLIEKGTWLLIIVFGAVQILGIHGVNVSGLIAGLGLGGLAFALAAKDTIENIFGAIAILIDQPFKVGDNISMGGLSGVVEHIGLRSTRLRTAENSLISLPNSKIIASHVDNLGARPSIRVRFVLNLPFSTPASSIEALCAGIRELLSTHPVCVRDSIVVHFNEVTPSSFGVLVQFNLALNAWSEEQRNKEQIFLAIVRLMKELDLSLAVPSQQVMISRETKEPAERQPQDGIEAAKRLGISWT